MIFEDKENEHIVRAQVEKCLSRPGGRLEGTEVTRPWKARGRLHVGGRVGGESYRRLWPGGQRKEAEV